MINFLALHLKQVKNVVWVLNVLKKGIPDISNKGIDNPILMALVTELEDC